MKICPVGAELFQTAMTKLRVFSQFCEHADKSIVLCD